MNAINYGIRSTNMAIPEAILRYGLVTPNTDEHLLSLDNLLLTKVIRPIVMVDMNAYGSNKLSVSTNECDTIYSGSDGTTYHVPKKLTNFRSIAIPISLTMSGFAQMLSKPDSDIDKVRDSMGNVGGYINSNVTLIGENTIFVAQYMETGTDTFLNFIIENDSMLNNISSRNYMALGELFVLATKAYIYNQTVLKLNEGYILHGHSSDTFKDIINEWSDALQEYKEYFNLKWRKISFINDKPRKSNLIKSMFSSNL